MRAPLVRILIAFAAVATLLPRAARAGSEPHWLRIDSSHFTLLTDGDLGKGREVIVRFEQMRGEFAQLLYKSRVNMPEPIDIIALNSDEEYAKVAPSRQGTGLDKAFFISGDDRYYFVLNLTHEDSWRAISRDFAQSLLNYNYPPTQPWFDTGFAEYFSSVKLTDKQMEIGGDPNPGNGESYISVLSNSQWLSLPQLFTSPPAAQASLFNAESWLLLHYLLNNEKLPAAGTYFGLVETQKLPTEEAIQKAFGVSSAQFEQTLKDYFHSLATKLQTATSTKPAQSGMPAPVAADVIGTSNHDMAASVAHAMVAEMALRLPEHRDEARNQLTSMVNQAQVDNTVVHRALAWDYLQKKDFDHAIEELANGLVFDAKDPMSHYYLALCRYEAAKATSQQMKGLANMMQDLHLVLDWKHEFADAYYMLGVAQTEGGGLRAAAESIRAAIQLSPRRTDYLLELARIYEDGKSWDAATALLDRLSTNSNADIASAAKKQLHDLPYIKKYGIPPADSGDQAASSAPTTSTANSPAAIPAKTSSSKKPSPDADDSDAEASAQPPPAPQIDRRPIQFLKGKLLSVDCSQAPAAVVKVAAGAKTMSLRTADYKSLMLVGADTFSCDWSDRSVAVNYKPGGKADGDLVSLELR